MKGPKWGFERGNEIDNTPAERIPEARNLLGNIPVKYKSKSGHMPLFACISFVACTGLFSGCGTMVTHVFPDSKNPVYGGIRADCHAIVHPEAWGVFACVDLPFSFVADTLLLPSDINEWSNLSRPDPMKDWTFKHFPVDRRGNITTNTLAPAIVEDYQDFIKMNGLSVMGGGVTGYFEDGKGHLGVKFEGFAGNESWVYALIYDNNNKRVKAVKFNRSRYMC